VTVSRPHSQFPWLKARFRTVAEPWNRIGRQTKFYGTTLRSIHIAVTSYRVELIRQIAAMGLGAGALILIGGTIAIVGFLTVTTGALVAVQGYTDFSEIGVEALTGFASAFFNVRHPPAESGGGKYAGSAAWVAPAAKRRNAPSFIVSD